LEAELLDEITRLMNLQAIDRQLQELEQSLSSIAGRVEQLREQLNLNLAEYDRISEQDKLVAANRKKAEKELAEGEARIRNKRMRLNLVRNDKELQATAHEVETLKESNQRLEAEALALLEGQDARTARIAELNELTTKGKAEVAAAEKEIASQVEELRGNIGKVKAEREKISREIPANLVSRYDMIFSRRAGLAVANSKGGTCQGCRMRLPPQLFNEIQKHLQIHFCPNCQRILYYEP
jgi:predicted  nucleic acid-binding Zn-ribbon protein